MIEESHNIEHKESWRDEYLKWICGFANAQGGRVYIGVDVNAQVRAMGTEERMAPILEHVLHNHRVTNADVQKMLGVSRATAMRLLKKLDSMLEPVGHGAGGYYRIRNY